MDCNGGSAALKAADTLKQARRPGAWQSWSTQSHVLSQQAAELAFQEAQASATEFQLRQQHQHQHRQPRQQRLHLRSQPASRTTAGVPKATPLSQATGATTAAAPTTTPTPTA